MSRVLTFLNLTVMGVTAFLVVLGVVTGNWLGAVPFAVVFAACLVIHKLRGGRKQQVYGYTKAVGDNPLPPLQADPEEQRRRQRMLDMDFEEHLRRERYRTDPDAFL